MGIAVKVATSFYNSWQHVRVYRGGGVRPAHLWIIICRKSHRRHIDHARPDAQNLERAAQASSLR